MKGFTLIELIVVIAILGILAAVMIPKFTGMRGSANESAAKSTITNIQKAAEMVAVEQNIAIGSVTEAQIEAILDITFDEMDGNPNGATYAWNASSGFAEVSGITVPGTLGESFNYSDL